MSIAARLSMGCRKLIGNELFLFLAYAVIVFRPGAAPPKHPDATSDAPKAVPADWSNEEYQLYIDEARIDMASQQEDKRDIRARAQIILTTSIVVGGAAVTSFEDTSHLCLCGKLLYAASMVAIVVAGLASGGIISSQSPIGAPNVLALPFEKTGHLFGRAADEYAYSRRVGMETVAVLVTVLRDCVLSLILGAVLLAIAVVRT